jgi:hypothetical protein
MSWLRFDDGFNNDPAILHISRNRGEADRFLGMVTALALYCARHLTDGFLPALIVREHVRSARLLQLLTDPGEGVTALLHRRGADCECLEGIDWPNTGGDYFLHHYLKFNPTKAEYDVKRAKEAELRDRELIAAIRRRDRDRCRYCGVQTIYADRRSSRGLVVDHVDPAVAAGAANLVIACRGCNSRKGQRTPAAAGMTLLAPPDLTGLQGDLVPPHSGQVSTGPGWSAPTSSSAPGPSPGRPADTDQAPTSRPTNQPTNQPTNRSDPDPTTHVPVRDGTGRATDPAPPQRRTLTPPLDAGPAGPAGHRDPTGPPPPRTSSRHPDPYRRQAITGPDPADHAGLPDPDHPP